VFGDDIVVIPVDKVVSFTMVNKSKEADRHILILLESRCAYRVFFANGSKFMVDLKKAYHEAKMATLNTSWWH